MGSIGRHRCGDDSNRYRVPYWTDRGDSPRGNTVNRAPRPFRYFDECHMAVVGKSYAALERSRLHTGGFLTWLVRAFVHILSLLPLQNGRRGSGRGCGRMSIGQPSSRLIPEPPRTPNG